VEDLRRTKNSSKRIQLIPRWKLDRLYSSWVIPCAAFTVAELGEMLPETYYSGSNQFGSYWCSTVNVTDRTFVADTEADARAKMLIYLVENKLIAAD
jgi:hypothetical protein